MTDLAAAQRLVATAASRPHPRLILTAERVETLRARVASPGLAAEAFGELRRRAETLLTEPTATRTLDGRRLLEVSRRVLGRVMTLACCHRITLDPRFAQRAEQELLAVCAFPDWNPSHWLDVAELAFACAIGLDWLHDALPSTTRAAVRAALRGKAFATWTPIDRTNNWNDVCNGAMIQASLALAETDAELASRTLAAALAVLPTALAEYGPGGTHPEGPDWYWGYATSYTVPTLASLRSACGDDAGLSTRFHGLLASADFRLHMHGPTGLVVNCSDAGDGTPGAAPQVFWLAAELRRPDLAWRELHHLRQGLAAGTAMSDRFAALRLLWLPEEDPPAPQACAYRGHGVAPIASHRSAWEPSASFVTLKGGSPGTSHAHMDVGSFIVEADGVRWAVDLGAEPYARVEAAGVDLWGRGQDAQRWTLFRLGEHGHGVLTVAGRPQRVDGHAPIVASSDEATVVDLASLYEPALAAARRGVRLLPSRRILVQDELRAGAEGATVRWAMPTRAAVTLTGVQALLAQDGRRLAVRVLEPADARLEAIDCARPPLPVDSPDPGLSMLVFRVTLAPGASARLRVLLTPGTAGDPPLPEPAPLAAWFPRQDSNLD